MNDKNQEIALAIESAGFASINDAVEALMSRRFAWVSTGKIDHAGFLGRGPLHPRDDDGDTCMRVIGGWVEAPGDGSEDGFKTFLAWNGERFITLIEHELSDIEADLEQRYRAAFGIPLIRGRVEY